MQKGYQLFFAVLAVMVVSWLGLVVFPQIQLGSQSTREVKEIGRHYPTEPGSLVLNGRKVYQQAGCVACHTQQIRQSGYAFDLVLNEVGDFPEIITSKLIEAGKLAGIQVTNEKAQEQMANLPSTFLEARSFDVAQDVLKIFKDSGATVVADILPLGPDIERGWGPRQTVGLDYLYHQPLLMGQQRLGPDLANVGVRLNDPQWHLKHLYHPRSVVTKSSMPAYTYLFDVQLIGEEPSPHALALEGDYAPEEGMEIVPKPEALALVDYLLSLKIENPVFEAPYMFTQAEPGEANNAKMEQAQ